MPSLFFQQVRALVRKDFQIIRVHRRKMIAELIFPIMMSCLCCFLLVQIGGQIAQFTTFSSIIDSYESGCYTNWLGFVQPWSYSQMNQLYNGTCGFQSSVGYSNTTAGIEAWIAAVNQSNGYGYGYAERAVLWSGTPDNVTLFTSPYYGRSAVLNLASALQNDLLPLASQLHLSGMMGNGLSMLQYNVYQTMATAATIMLCMVFLPMASSTAGRLVDEKRTKVREHLKVMGVSPLAYLTSSLCTSMLRVLFAVLVIAVVLFGWAGSTVSPGHILTVLVMLYLYGLTISAWAHVAPAFFTKPQLSNAFMSLFIMAGVISAPFITMLEGNLIVPFALFFSPVNAMFCIAPILGKQIVTLAVSPSLCIFFAVLQVVMYSAIAEYLYAINPGDYGVPMHPLYPFMRIFQLCGLCLTREQRERQQFLAGGAKDAAGVTEHDRIVIRELVKYFGSQRDVAAVDHLSLTIRHKEIFALLGHNGAGKTTTISMLIGMIPATDYELCTIEGYDTTTEMDQIRRSIACCPQFDVLYDDLSGRQHLELFAGVKGVSAASAAESMLQRLHLPLDDQPSSTYSGGMKRRLSVGNALIGGSQVIFLDEPSSGLDPLSRRRLWGLLRDERDAGKTIVLTTHFMEEADYLGDRIAIMSHGKLVCCDTSTNLKHNYGVGYYVSVVKNPDDPARFDTPGVLALLRRHCDGQGTIHHESNADVIFLLPVSMVDRFGPMLEELESQLSFYNASSYGVAMNSLEDVFVAISEQQEAMRVGARTGVVNEHSTSPSKEKHPNATEHDTTLTDTGKSTAELFTAATYEGFFALLVFQTWAMMIKKACVWRRSLRLIFLGLVVPVLFVVAAYAAAIPKFGNQNDNIGGNYYWIPQTALMEVPTFDKPITVALYASDQGFGPTYFGDEPPAVDMQCASNLMNRFATRYAELFKAQTGVAKQLTFTYISDKNAIQNCAFYDTHSISWLAEQNFDVIIFINECSSANSNQFGWSWFYNRAYDTQVLVSLDMAMRTAATSFRFPDVATPIFYFEHLPSLVVSAPPTTGTPAPPSPQEFILVPLAVLIVMGVAQFAANTALPVADELNKKTFDTLRMHGLMASSFWLGHYVFDMLTALPFVILFIIGPSVRGIHYMAFADTISVDAFALILLVSFALLSAYAIVSMLPHGTKQSTYVVVIFLANSICLSLPFVLLAIYIAANPSVGFDSSTVEPLSFLFPQRCFMYIVTSQPKTESSWELTGTHKALASMIVWQLVPLLALWWFSHSDLAKRYELPFAGAVPKPSSHATEAQALLSVQNARSPLLSTADVDVLREYDRIASQVSVLSGDPTAVVVAETHDVDGPVTKATSGVVPVSHDMHFVKDLRKEFHGSCIPCCGLHDKVAVQSLTFGIKRGECFGLLGPNGAGKTTSVKMMLRELVQTSGVIHCASAADATSMCDQMPPSRGALYRASRLGVCQQHDTLWDQLNAEEHMRLFLRVRLGSLYQHNDWTNYIESALAKVQLSEGGEKASEKFSGGMKRKLSVCIAMYTGATAVFLDEPSTGMDPHARRALWKSIHEALQHDRCVLLTTHSMEEADAVCARIAIVTDGLMQCIGSSQHLKSRYGTGYSIVLTLRPIAAESGFEPSQVPNADDPRASVVDTAMGCVFGPTCVLKEALGLQRRYAVTELQSVALAFRRLAEHREAWFLENYSVTQLTSLEQIFIEFAGWSSGDN